MTPIQRLTRQIQSPWAFHEFALFLCVLCDLAANGLDLPEHLHPSRSSAFICGFTWSGAAKPPLTLDRTL